MIKIPTWLKTQESVLKVVFQNLNCTRVWGTNLGTDCILMKKVESQSFIFMEISEKKMKKVWEILEGNLSSHFKEYYIALKAMLILKNTND